jgi:predicted transcriptional regulator
MSERHRQIAALVAEGYSKHAIANRLGVAVSTVSQYITELGVVATEVPADHLTLRQVHDRTGLTVESLKTGIKAGTLHSVFIGNTLYLTMVEVMRWLSAHRSRATARTLLGRALRGPSTRSQ